MFTFFKGRIQNILTTSVIAVNDGWGLEIHNPYNLSLMEEVAFYLHTNFSSETGMTFFGFFTLEELEFFQLLISVPGLGAKTTIKLLQNIGMKGVANALYHKDNKLLMKIPGIGNKIANRMVTELWEKIPPHLWEVEESYQLLSTLMTIGYEKNAILKILSTIDKKLPFEEQLRQSMVLLQK